MQLEHVTVPVPAGQIDRVHDFYGIVLGLEEIPTREQYRQLRSAYRLGTAELHLIANSGWKPPHENADHAQAGPHFGLVVESIEQVRRQLEDHGVETEEQALDIPNRRRLYCRDPFGNLIEFIEFEAH